MRPRIDPAALPELQFVELLPVETSAGGQGNEQVYVSLVSLYESNKMASTLEQ
jgi:hypothetical protein